MVFCVLFKQRNLALEREKEDFFLYKRCTKSLEKKEYPNFYELDNTSRIISSLQFLIKVWINQEIHFYKFLPSFYP